MSWSLSVTKNANAYSGANGTCRAKIRYQIRYHTHIRMNIRMCAQSVVIRKRFRLYQYGNPIQDPPMQDPPIPPIRPIPPILQNLNPIHGFGIAPLRDDRATDAAFPAYHSNRERSVPAAMMHGLVVPARPELRPERLKRWVRACRSHNFYERHQAMPGAGW